MEYAEKGNLLAYIRAAKKADTLSYGLQIAKGMEHLASKMVSTLIRISFQLSPMGSRGDLI